MMRLVLLALSGMIFGTIYFYRLLLKKRKELEGLPCPPIHSLLLGHLYVAADCQKAFPPGTHMHQWMPYMQKKYNLPDVFYIDWWPIGPRWIFMSDPEMISREITTDKSILKSTMLVAYLNEFLGKNNLVSVEGHQWKQLRSIFNPGFSASHLMTLVPYILDASMIYVGNLRKKAQTNELFQLEEDSTRVTVDIIGKVVLDIDLNSQIELHPIVETFRARVALMPSTGGPIDLSRFDIVRRLKLWVNGRRLERLIGEELDKKMAERRSNIESKPKSFRDRKRSVVDLALDAFKEEQSIESGQKLSSNPGMDKAFRQIAIDSLKTFIFAGHDTTASTITYAFYLLHLYPHVHQRIVKELDTVFSPGASAEVMADMIRADPYIINRLEYITAVVKEILRLFPPASTLRHQPAESDPSQVVYMTNPKTGQQLPLSGWDIWPAAILVMRNEEFFPQPTDFIPERFIPSLTPFPDCKLFTPAGKDAWRPFEKGPRNCIGQELAMIEAKVIVALSVRDLDFVAEYDGVKIHHVTPVDSCTEAADGIPGKERMTIEGHKAYQMLKGTAKPKDGMPGRMHIRRS